MLSVDEIMLSLFDRELSENHDVYTQKVKEYLFRKSLDIAKSGIDVVLDWGFWSRDAREIAKEFYKARNIESELHYIDIGDEIWKSRIKDRNCKVVSKTTDAYYVDDALANKCLLLFEIPKKEEIDVWVNPQGENYVSKKTGT